MFFTVFIYICLFFLGFTVSIGYKHKTLLYNLYNMGVITKCLQIQTMKKMLYIFMMMCKTSCYYIIQTYLFQHVSRKELPQTKTEYMLL